MKTVTVCFILAITVVAPAGVMQAEPLVLATETTRLVIELQGGAFTVFENSEKGINPLTWDSVAPENTPVDSARQRGHFLCLDRWGPASKAEAARGMPPHGEASRVTWRVSTNPAPQGNFLTASIGANLAKARLMVLRNVRLHKDVSVFHVTESVRNNSDIGRIYNVVQHPSIAPPFLNRNTVVNCNATTGFPQSYEIENPEERISEWPTALNPEGVRADISRLGKDDYPRVVSYVIEEDYGWITAHDPVSRTVLGYVWKTRNYPWISLWRKSVDGKPAARGLEFGTTGLHRPYADLVKKGKILGRPLYNFIDAGETQTYEYICFLADVDKRFKGVQRVDLKESEIILLDEAGRSHLIPVGISLLRL